MKAISCPQVSFSFHTRIFSAQPLDTFSPSQIRVFDSIEDVSAFEIKSLVPDNIRALLAGTEAGQMSGMSFKYAISTQDGKPAMFSCFQILTFPAAQIRTFTPRPENAASLWGMAKNLAARVAKNMLEKRQIRILVSGNALLTGQTGIYHAPFLPEAEAYRQLPGIIDKILSQNPGIDAVLLKDHLTLPDTIAQEWGTQGYQAFATEPEMVMPVLWENVDDYHLDMASKYRQRLKSAYKKSAGVSRRELTYTEVVKNKHRLFSLFESILNEDRFNLVPHSPDYLPSLKSALGEKCSVYGYFSDGQMVAFQTFIVIEDVLCCHFIGYDCELNREQKLYQRMLYDVVAMAIEGRFKRISFGRTAMEIKSTVGAVPVYPVCYLKFTRPLINQLAAPYLRNVKIEDWQPRNPFKTPVVA